MKQEWFLIWSNEHKAWWGPASRGYVYDSADAGRYSRNEAMKICNGANYGWNSYTLPNELPILEEMAINLERNTL